MSFETSVLAIARPSRTQDRQDVSEGKQGRFLSTQDSSIVSSREGYPLECSVAHLLEAVLDAYAWAHDLPDDQILERLLALNFEHVAAQGRT